MGGLDMLCMLSPRQSINNCYNVSLMDTHSPDLLKQRFLEFARRTPRLTARFKFIAGDPYWEMMDPEDAMEKVFLGPESEEKRLRCLSDVDQWIEDTGNQLLSIDGPLIRIYI